MANSIPEKPWAFEWSPENIKAFWNLVVQSPMEKSSFSKICANELSDFVENFINKDSTILDFGGGSGHFCKAMLNAGYKIGIFEPSGARCDAVPSEVVNHKNFLGFINSGKFDCVTCFEVLEHIHPDLIGFSLNLIQNLVKDNGLLIGSVPCNENLENALCICPNCAAMFHRWQHMRSFTPELLKGFLKKYGFEISAIDRPKFSLYSMFFVAPNKYNTKIQ